MCPQTCEWYCTIFVLKENKGFFISKDGNKCLMSGMPEPFSSGLFRIVFSRRF